MKKKFFPHFHFWCPFERLRDRCFEGERSSDFEGAKDRYANVLRLSSSLFYNSTINPRTSEILLRFLWENYALNTVCLFGFLKNERINFNNTDSSNYFPSSPPRVREKKHFPHFVVLIFFPFPTFPFSLGFAVYNCSAAKKNTLNKTWREKNDSPQLFFSSRASKEKKRGTK